jgi:hypothetical protein
VPAREAFDLSAQGSEGVAPLALDGLHLLLGPLQRGFEGLDELSDGGLALFQRVLGDDLIAAQRFPREAQEHFAVGAQGLARERVERIAQPRLGLFKRGDALAFFLGFRLSPNALAFERDLQRMLLATGSQRRDEIAERQSDTQRNDGKNDGD